MKAAPVGIPFKEGCWRPVVAGRAGGLKSRSFKLTKAEVELASQLRNDGLIWKDVRSNFVRQTGKQISISALSYAVRGLRTEYPETLN